MIPAVLGVGALVILVGAALFYYGKQMSPDDTVDMGLGTHYDRTAFEFRGIFIIVIGAIALIVGIFANIS